MSNQNITSKNVTMEMLFGLIITDVKFRLITSTTISAADIPIDIGLYKKSGSKISDLSEDNKVPGNDIDLSRMVVTRLEIPDKLSQESEDIILFVKELSYPNVRYVKPKIMEREV